MEYGWKTSSLILFLPFWWHRVSVYYPYLVLMILRQHLHRLFFFYVYLFVCMERVRRSEMHCLLSLWTWDLDSGWACTKHPYPTYSLSLLTSYSLMFLFFDHFDHAGLEFPFSLPTLLKCWSIPTIYSLSVLMFQLGTFLLNLRKPPKLCIV